MTVDIGMAIGSPTRFNPTDRPSSAWRATTATTEAAISDVTLTAPS